MIRTNEKTLVQLALQGTVAPSDEYLPFEVGHDGTAYALPGVGSITYNVRVGDPAFGWTSDHTEPGVSTMCTSSEKKYSKGYNFLSCIGNEVRVISGAAKGAHGTVTGKHGGVEHVLVDFPQKVIDKLALEDKFIIRAYGQGLAFLDCPEVKCYNLSPVLLHAMDLKIEKKLLTVGVSHIVPAGIMGSGLGSLNCTRGDYDITTQDSEMVKKYRLDSIRLGDIIAIQDADNSFGRCYKKGAVSICVVAHANSFIAGHGPGVTTILTCSKALIQPTINPDANIAAHLKIGRFEKR